MKLKAFTFTLLIILVFSWCEVYSQAPVIKVSPPESYLQLNTIGEVFISVENISTCRAYSIELSYNAQIVRCLSVARGSFFSGWNTFFFTMIDSNSKLIKVDEAILGTGYESGSGDLFKVEFLALTEGDVNLDFITADLRDTLNNQIQIQTENGILHVVNPTYVESDLFNVDNFSIKAYPNPFNFSTKIELVSDNLDKTNLSIYAITGERVFSFGFSTTTASRNSFLWNGEDNDGNTLPSGIYFLVAKNKDFLQTLKIIMLK